MEWEKGWSLGQVFGGGSLLEVLVLDSFRRKEFIFFSFEGCRLVSTGWGSDELKIDLSFIFWLFIIWGVRKRKSWKAFLSLSFVVSTKGIYLGGDNEWNESMHEQLGLSWEFHFLLIFCLTWVFVLTRQESRRALRPIGKLFGLSNPNEDDMGFV